MKLTANLFIGYFKKLLLQRTERPNQDRHEEHNRYEAHDRCGNQNRRCAGIHSLTRAAALGICLSAAVISTASAGPATGIEDNSSENITVSGGDYLTESVEGSWQRDKFGWWYLLEDGTYPASRWLSINGKWYYFKESGYMADSPVILNGIQYYLGESGAMTASTWVEFREEEYYFNVDGSMARNCWVDDVHYVDEDGRMVKDRWVDGVYIDEDGIGEHPDSHFFD